MCYDIYMKIESRAFRHGGFIPQEFTCNGSNISPELTFTNVPTEAKSLVLIMDDPDVPVALREDRIFDHWILFNIKPDVTTIPEGGLEDALVGTNTRGTVEYRGPCPPDTLHRYFFKLYALDVVLNLESGAIKKEVEDSIQNHILEKAELIGIYEQADELKTM